MANKTEKTWKPVSLKKIANDEPYKINNYSVSSDWYNRIIDNTGSRYNRLSQYNDADCKSVEISRALDVIAEDISSCNADNQEFFIIDYPDDSKVKRSVIKTMGRMKELWEKRTDFDDKLFNRVRDTIKYGAIFFKRNVDGTLTRLPTERFVGYILANSEDEKITHYLYDPSITKIGHEHKVSGVFGNNNLKSNKSGYEKYSVDDLLILKVGNGAFGESLIERVYRTWKQMDMLEEAVLIYRVVRAPERRVYYIDVGNLQGAKREQAINSQRMRLMQKKVGRNAHVEVEYDPHSSQEDIFIPTNSTGKGSRIETLPSGQALGELSDLEWFSKKMAAGLRVPASMIDPQGDQQQQFSDMRVGQSYQIEMRYLGHVKRLKRQIQHGIIEDFHLFCEDRDVVVPEDMIFRINDSMSFALYKDIEINQSLLNVFNSTLQISSLSKKYALQKYMNISQEDIDYNTLQKLQEMGLDEAKIKELPDNVIENLVYGDGRLAKEAGISPPVEGGGFGF